MTEIVSFLSALFRSVLGTSIQASVIVVLILFASWALRHRISAHVRHGLWLILLIKLMVPLLPSSSASLFNWVAIPVPQPIESNDLGFLASDGRATIPSSQEGGLDSGNDFAAVPQQEVGHSVPVDLSAPESIAERAPWNWELFASSIWLSVCVFFLLQLILQNLRFMQVLRRGRLIENSSALRLLRTQANLIGLARTPSVVESSAVLTPAVYGLWKPRIVLPTGMIDELEEEQLSHVFLHEMAHLKRRDLWVHCLAHLLRCIHWFNPFIWFAVTQMRRDCEVATDALALGRGSGENDQAYGETILLMVKRVGKINRMPGLMGVVEGKKEMARRILFIRDFRSRPKLTLVGIGVVLILSLVSLTQALPGNPIEPSDENVSVVSTVLVATEATVPPEATQGTTIFCTVVDPDGNPVPKTKIELGTKDWWFVDHGESDASGQFSVLESQFKPDLVLRAPGFAPTLIPFDYDTSQTNRVFQLEAAAEIRGIVVDAQGNPIDEAEVIPTSWYQFRTFDRGLKSGSDGRFVWADGPNHGKVFFTVFAKGFKSVRDLMSPVGTELRVQMTRPDHVVGTVVDAKTGEAIPKFKFELGQRVRPDGPVMNIRHRGDGENGSFEVDIREPAESFHLVTVMADGYAPSVSSNFQDGVGRLALRFELEPAVVLQLSVLEPDGLPAAESTVVQWMKDDHQVWISSPRKIALRRVREKSRIGTTDAAGRVDVLPLADMTGLVFVHESGFAELELAELQANPKVQLQAWSRVEGTLFAGPDAIEDASLGLFRIDRRVSHGGAIVSLDTVTGPGGRFEFSGLPAGTYRLKREQGTQVARFEVETGRTTELSVGRDARILVGQVEVAGSEIEDLNWNREDYYLKTDLPLPAHIKSPTFEEQRADPGALQRFFLERDAYWRSPEGQALKRTERTYAVEIDHQGMFRIEGVEPGSYQLAFHINERERTSARSTSVKRIASVTRKVVVTSEESGGNLELIDLGRLVLERQ